MECQVRLVEAAPRILAAVRRQTDHSRLSATIIESLDLVYAYLKGPLATTTKRGLNIVVYLDDAMTIESGVEVDGPFTPCGEVICSATPAGTAATATHLGPYTELGSTHSAIRQWCAAEGKELAGPSWEVYGHWTDDASQLRTDVFYLL